MPHDLRRTLVVPMLLAVTIIAAPACQGDDKTTETEAPSESTAVPTDGGQATSGTDTGDTTGGLDCAAIGAAMATCQATTGCAWDLKALYPPSKERGVRRGQWHHRGVTLFVIGRTRVEPYRLASARRPLFAIHHGEPGA